MSTVTLSKQILVLGPWRYLKNPKLYDFIEKLFHSFKGRNQYLLDFKRLYEKGGVDLITSRGRAKINIKIPPKANSSTSNIEYKRS